MPVKQTVYVHGDRQTGRTERMVWICVGAILAGAWPCIAARTAADYEQTWRRLARALHDVGLDDEEAQRLARAAVLRPTGHGGGKSFRLVEIDS